MGNTFSQNRSVCPVRDLLRSIAEKIVCSTANILGDLNAFKLKRDTEKEKKTLICFIGRCDDTQAPFVYLI